MTVITRHAARGLIMTPQHQVLLIKLALPWVPGGAWTVPGGGMEKGEAAQACVRRELFEETGLKNANITRELWQCDFTYQFKQKQRRALERFFLVEAEKFEPTTQHMIDYELIWMLGFKWWSADEILNSDESFSPQQLGQIVTQLSTGTYPDNAIFITDPLPKSYRPA